MHLKLDLLLVAWNTNYLASRYAEMVEFAARHKPEVLLFGKAHIDPAKRFRFTNYVFHRSDRAGGGTATASVFTSS